MSRGLILDNVSVSLSGKPVVKSLGVEIPGGELTCILGPSGCGKTTTLNLIAGFLTADEGSIVLNGRDIGALRPSRRDIGVVFQSYALFPHMSVFDNIAYGLRARKVGEAEIRTRVMDVIGMLELDDLGGRYPSQLSGGQQQRVAVARGIVIEPQLLLLDEPLSNLDTRLREQVRVDFRRLQERLGITTLFVTHDQREAMLLADNILLMDQGSVVQAGAPESLYRRPNGSFAAGFFGVANRIPVVADGDWLVSEIGFRIPRTGETEGTELVGLRSSDFLTASSCSPAIWDECVKIDVTLEEAYYRGDVFECVARPATAPGVPLQVEIRALEPELAGVQRHQALQLGVLPASFIAL